jgi:hypothetical protein
MFNYNNQCTKPFFAGGDGGSGETGGFTKKLASETSVTVVE